MNPIARRFWDRVPHQPIDGCWEWCGSKDKDGYGRLRNADKHLRATHIALMLDGRPLKPGEWALHRCDNPSCVRPSHLFAGDHAANVADKVAKGRQSRTGAKNPTRGDAHWSRQRPERLLRGEAHGRVTVSDADVEKIRQRVAAGESRADLAREFGVSWTSINNYVRGRSRSQSSIFDVLGGADVHRG